MLNNPFVEPKRGAVGRRRYHVITWGGAVLLSVLVTGYGNRDQEQYCFPAAFAAQDCSASDAQ